MRLANHTCSARGIAEAPHFGCALRRRYDGTHGRNSWHRSGCVIDTATNVASNTAAAVAFTDGTAVYNRGIADNARHGPRREIRTRAHTNLIHANVLGCRFLFL